jgi:hypothetical protein
VTPERRQAVHKQAVGALTQKGGSLAFTFIKHKATHYNSLFFWVSNKLLTSLRALIMHQLQFLGQSKYHIVTNELQIEPLMV